MLTVESKLMRPMPPDEVETYELRPLSESTMELEPLQQPGNTVIKLTRAADSEADAKRNPG